MRAISGTRRQMREMADGTIRVQVDIDPACRAAFLSMFGNIDMPVALAPLVADFERANQCDSTRLKPSNSVELKGGPLARLAGRLCANPEFQDWLGLSSADDAADEVRNTCKITSRAELDHNSSAARIFHSAFRIPFSERAK